MKATIKFRTDRATDWYVTKEFADEKHLDNYIGYIYRTKQGYLCDEVFLEYKTCDRCSYDLLDEDGDVLEHYCIDNKLYTPNFYDSVKDAEERHWDDVATYNERFSGDDY